jgi:hypothetical protein
MSGSKAIAALPHALWPGGGGELFAAGFTPRTDGFLARVLGRNWRSDSDGLT